MTEKLEVKDVETQMVKLPVLPLRDLVVYPKMMIPILVGREVSIKAIDEAMVKERFVVVVTQKDMSVESPKQDELHTIGTITEILQLLKLPDGTVKLLVEGRYRVAIDKVTMSKGGYLVANFGKFDEITANKKEIKAVERVALLMFEEYVKINSRIPPELVSSLNSCENASETADMMCSHLTVPLEEKQELLGIQNLNDRFKKIVELLVRELEVLRTERKIMSEVKQRIEKNQRELYLQEQLRVIEKELGQKDSTQEELDQLKKQIKDAKMPKTAQESCEKELSKLSKMHPISPEAAVSRNYIDWMVSLPWNKKSKDSFDIEHANEILEKEHYGLQKPKERILEYLAVCQHTQKLKGQILCFVGPPGVGKTSLARSIANALGRKFVRLSLGGVRDEAEIKGHRRTYIGALPGRIIQSLRKVGTKNPVFLLDEIDKMASDYRHDPASALLEVLDPEENAYFSDHFLENEFDLSDVLFITTANSEYSIPLPLHNRLEMIRFSSYTENEKVEIALNHLVPKQRAKHGLSNGQIKFSRTVLSDVIRKYTREAGVRELERFIASLCRKITKKIISKKTKEYGAIKKTDLEPLLGPPEFLPQTKLKKSEVGIATGLCWTPTGGDVLFIECSVTEGKGDLLLTGKLGEVMRESAQAALGYIKRNVKKFKLDASYFKDIDIHIHVPEGAISKDGPSAGITIAVALVSSFMKKPINHKIAMTGEITLSGRVLAIGGLKEKVLAAVRDGIKIVVIPEENRKDLVEIPKEVRDAVSFVLVTKVNEVFDVFFK